MYLQRMDGSDNSALTEEYCNPDMTIFEIDPTTDNRWDDLLEAYPKASIFHMRGWLKALQQTYGYAPVAFTTSPPGSPLLNGVPFCLISSWLGGRRLVSLPFSDHCTPLVENPNELTCVLGYLQQKMDVQKWQYIEIRPRNLPTAEVGSLQRTQTFFFHKLDFCHSIETLLQNTHKDCVQRKIQRALREGLICEEGRSDSLLKKFYYLLLKTRRRHGLPAQPIAWFQNLLTYLGEHVKIRVASKDGQPIASIITIHYRHTLVYKYGCSDRRFSNLGGTQLLLWKAIQEGKEYHISEFDMGRSDRCNSGLAAFKDRWGATREELVYFRYPEKKSQSISDIVQARMNRYIWSHAPERILAAAGRAFYRYMG